MPTKVVHEIAEKRQSSHFLSARDMRQPHLPAEKGKQTFRHFARHIKLSLAENRLLAAGSDKTNMLAVRSVARIGACAAGWRVAVCCCS